MTPLMAFLVMLHRTLELAMDKPPLHPGGAWTVPICSRHIGECRMYPHIHYVLRLWWDGSVDIGMFDLEEV